MEIIPGSQLPVVLDSDQIASHVSPDADYIRFTVEALDDHGAGAAALQEWARMVDALAFYRFGYPPVPRQVLLFAHEQRRVAVVEATTFVLPSDGSIESLRRAVAALDDRNCSQADQDRVRAAFRHFRLANEAASFEAKFSSLWTALETVGRSGEDGAIIAHLKELIPPVLCRRYPYRFLRNFVEDARRCGVDLGVDGERDVSKLLDAILDEAGRRQELSRRVRSHSLLSSRFSQICAQVKDAQALAETLSGHHTRVKWHLQRLYRVRNAIVHRGHVNLPVQAFVRHLQDYVWSSVTELCYLITEFGIRGLDDALELARDSHLATVDLLKTKGATLHATLAIAGVLGLMSGTGNCPGLTAT